ncbi:4-hydroxy-tetrahydrodipicolinate synthase [Kocuria sp. JC486]|uniref:4-hydroxy-tetrahydrodipicolinate synthase n=1 Tax=Kocuria sp. JC486 TaxID=1970736 RepID=UPI00141EB5C4|nr:4-hydroxy-tetrahydrodipicolinate synthase [Kocuria sp. JC486]NHU85156.1 4-hydroxy-tetrahydrodipicolinate synthase [Kocuria sp. JC486]
MTAHHDKPLFGTLLTAMVTPFKDDGSVDLAATEALAVRLVDQGCDGLVVGGTTGEYSTMTDNEHEAVFRTVKDAVGDHVALVAGAGSNDTQHTLHLSAQAQKAGMDGLLIVTPYYNKPTQTGVVAHFETVADSVELPIMLYDIPGRTGIPLSVDTLIRLAEHEKIVAVKDAKANLAEGMRVITETDLLYYSGDDGLTLPWMSIGAVGLVGVTSHVDTPRFRRLIDAMRAEDLHEALQIAHELEPVVRATMTHVPGAVAAKQILHWQGALQNHRVRLPYVDATDTELAAIKADLEGSVVSETLQF